VDELLFVIVGYFELGILIRYFHLYLINYICYYFLVEEKLCYFLVGYFELDVLIRYFHLYLTIYILDILLSIFELINLFL
jgi:hypothetical protein